MLTHNWEMVSGRYNGTCLKKKASFHMFDFRKYFQFTWETMPFSCVSKAK